MANEIDIARSSLPARPDENSGEEKSGIKLDDLLHLAFCHKAKILMCCLGGVGAAVLAWFLWPMEYVSEAKVLIRYVVESTPAAPTPGEKDSGDAQMKSPDARGENIVNSEMEIITSRDVAEQVAKEVGAEKILGSKKEKDNLRAAAGTIVKNINVEAARKSDVLRLTYTHADPGVAREVLNSMMNHYLAKHVEIHRAAGIYEGFLQTKTDDLQKELQQIEVQMLALKTNAGVVSFEDSLKDLATQISKLNETKMSAETEIASLEAVSAHGPATNGAAPQGGGPGLARQVERYRELSTTLNQLEVKEMEMIPIYTDANYELRNVRAQLAELRKRKEAMESATPALLWAAPAGANAANGAGPAMDPNRVVALAASIPLLTNQLRRLQAAAERLDVAAIHYRQLQRNKEISEANLRRYATSLEQARIDKDLGPGHVSNIGIVEKATPGKVASGKKPKICAALVMLGMLGGLAWAFLLEFVFSPAIKRPTDFKTKLNVPLFLWIPEVGHSGNGHAGKATNGNGGALPAGVEAVGTEAGENLLTVKGLHGLGPAAPSGAGVAPWGPRYELRHYLETLRDRVNDYFSVKNQTHKPKLVAITACSKGAGVSTIAAGLAALFGESGDGNILLVTVNGDRENGAGVHPFYRAHQPCTLFEALDTEKRQSALVQEHVYLASVHNGDGRLLTPRNFSHLVPSMKASDYDYIIFDMPPISQTSIATRLASQMDINLMVIEADADPAPKVQAAVEMLKEARAQVGGILNRRHFHVPKPLSHEL